MPACVASNEARPLSTASCVRQFCAISSQSHGAVANMADSTIKVMASQAVKAIKAIKAVKAGKATAPITRTDNLAIPTVKVAMTAITPISQPMEVADRRHRNKGAAVMPTKNKQQVDMVHISWLT